jgi:hypothetical protein
LLTSQEGHYNITESKVVIGDDDLKMTQFIIGILLGCLGLILTTVGAYMAKDGWEKMRHKKEKPSEVYNVESINQQGGITTGKIDNLNILTDKESLGIREADGLYQNGKKVGKVMFISSNWKSVKSA